MAFGTAKRDVLIRLVVRKTQPRPVPFDIYTSPITERPHILRSRHMHVYDVDAHVVAVISLLLTSIPIGSCVASSPSSKMESSWSWLTNTSDYVKYSPLFPNPLVCIRDIVKTGSVEVSSSMDIYVQFEQQLSYYSSVGISTSYSTCGICTLGYSS